jgi:hypothetical protein
LVNQGILHRLFGNPESRAFVRDIVNANYSSVVAGALPRQRTGVMSMPDPVFGPIPLVERPDVHRTTAKTAKINARPIQFIGSGVIVNR